ncbi:hypothetical protein Rhow_008358 [Rhodococcus wratislaviensis]|uniref:Uncharacterized protein n=1 Tax=Rhodococcus wratislaviensis TaxID=44752 RepID=A0A402CK83_RHOWR|nr:hypothetical protein Rhow_008358 [Rhodococcus wratislaviensis]
MYIAKALSPCVFAQDIISVHRVSLPVTSSFIVTEFIARQ